MSDKTQIQLKSIDCHGTSESGHDEVFLICQADGGIPIRYPAKPPGYQSMTSGDSWPLDPVLTLTFEHEVLITLWDSDVSYDPTVATYLVSYDYTTTNIPAAQNVMNPNGANYTLNVTKVS